MTIFWTKLFDVFIDVLMDKGLIYFGCGKL